jgi:chemotaxis protein MotB
MKLSAKKRNYLFLGFCSVALASCVSSGKYDKLAKEHDALLDQNKALTENIAQEKDKLSMTSEQLAAIKSKTEEKEALFAKLKKELSSELASQKITLREMKTGINVNLPEDILFASGSVKIRESGQHILSKVSEQLSNTNYQVIVTGYTDNVPISSGLAKRFPSNWDLAAARATNVVRLLEENKVPSDKLIAASFGENKPISSNDTEDGRKQNRRIEIHLRPVVTEE